MTRVGMLYFSAILRTPALELLETIKETSIIGMSDTPLSGRRRVGGEAKYSMIFCALLPVPDANMAILSKPPPAGGGLGVIPILFPIFFIYLVKNLYCPNGMLTSNTASGQSRQISIIYITIHSQPLSMEKKFSNFLPA